EHERLVPHHERYQQEEPGAPEARVEGEDETHRGRSDEYQQREWHARPEEHREEDADEDDPRSQVGLHHDEEPRGQYHDRRLPDVEERSRRLASCREHLREHQHHGDLRELRGLTETHATYRDPALRT